MVERSDPIGLNPNDLVFKTSLKTIYHVGCFKRNLILWKIHVPKT